MRKSRAVVTVIIEYEDDSWQHTTRADPNDMTDVHYAVAKGYANTYRRLQTKLEAKALLAKRRLEAKGD